MNERLVVINTVLSDPVDAAAVGALHFTEVVPANLTAVFVSAAPAEDDAGATLDINGFGITGIDVSDKDVPGTWISTHFGGTNAPATIAALGELSYDINNGAAENSFYVTIWALVGVG